MSTPYHARYFAHELTRLRPPGSPDRLSTALFDATVDLNPHQIDAALFALQSPLSKGAILADEVGLGKTIEAGLVMCQYWAEKKRKLLVVCPASIRKQWSLELEEKFNLPTLILDARSHGGQQSEGNPTPFVQNAVVITSLNFASKMQGEVRTVQWDLVVIDEAHKLRSVYRPSNRMGQNLKWALEGRKKLLLTATPLQNSLLELYGLSTILDDNIFGDVTSFRSQYLKQDSDITELRERLRDFCKRTLRKQVVEYVQYTERRAITKPFTPTDDEHKFYETLSSFLQREDTYSIPKSQRALITLILRKLLASSSHAIAGTLDTMRKRLVELRDGLPAAEDLAEQIILSEELEDEYLDETEGSDENQAPAQPQIPLQIDRAKLNSEILDLERFASWARGIGIDTKSRALLTALDIGFKEMERMGARRKALVFTESRRTQEYLRTFMEANGYAGKVVTFSGINSGIETQTIYERWVSSNLESGRVTGSRVIDIRTALIEHFRDKAEIMIATEAGGEGINLQFCSLVINYDLPWNPQRIEQRIGRCHRYGQKHDVVVVNFLNERNAADHRVLELLSEKFILFSGVFGASDEVLGTVESGVDFEKRILAIYQQCRTLGQIEEAFRQLREEMDQAIQARLEETRRNLLNHFDEDVHSRLRVQLDNARQQLDQIGRMFWVLSKYVLRDHAHFDDAVLAFDLHTSPRPDIETGRYHLISKSQDSVASKFLYRLSHPLGEHAIETGKLVPAPLATVVFDISNYPTRITAVENLKGKSGWLVLQKLTVQSFEKEEYLLFSAIDDDGHSVDHETCERMFRLTGSIESLPVLSPQVEDRLAKEAERHTQATIAHSLESNNKFFMMEREKLERWADDMVIAAEKELADVKAQIKAANRQARLAPTVEEQHAVQTNIRGLEKEQRRLRQRIFDVEDEIKDKRDKLISALERRLAQETSQELLFSARWKIV